MIAARIIGPNFVTVMVDGKTHVINPDHANYVAIRNALKIKDDAEVERLIDVAQSVVNFAGGKVTIDGGRVMYGNFEVKGPVVHRILDMVREGFDANPMILFLENLMSNPSKRAVDELYGFLEATALPITEDGCFLAYKKVRHDYLDHYTGTMNNSVGKVLEVPRNQVDEDKDRTCSHGLHFCSHSYLPHYGGGDSKVMIVKINPRDVVAIPSDYNNAKGRTCRYEVIGEHGDYRTEAFTAPVYQDDATPAQPSSTKKQNPSLAGYNQGRSDAAQMVGYDDSTDVFFGVDADRYAASYQKGYDSVDYGDDDASTADADVDWKVEGYNDGYHDAKNGEAYDDAAPWDCTAEFTYESAYANGWADAKNGK